MKSRRLRYNKCVDAFEDQIRQWRDKLTAGTLGAADFDLALEERAANNSRSRQKLLYLQAQSTAVDSGVIGMSIVEDGQVHEGPDDPAQWPYKTVLEAINDGWRVVKFPEMALIMEEDKTFGLGCEFILEKIA